MHSLVTALIAQQESEGLGNNAFARKLGVDKGTWSNVRRGLEAPAASIFSAAFRVYPEVVARVALTMDISNSQDVDSQQPVKVPA